MVLHEQYNRDNFINQIQKLPYCTDNFKRDGIYKAKKSQALHKLYIEHNNESFINSIVFDIDSPTAGIAWSDSGLPKPNIITQNPSNGHAHLLYALSSPVCITDNARRAPIKLLRGITDSFTDRLGADPCYTGKITKNPLNPHWRAFWGNPDKYDLNYLREFSDERKRVAKTPFIRETGTLGRNTTLFDNLRYYAYSVVFKYQKQEDFLGFMSALEEEATIINREFDSPLCFKEISHTVKSVSEWTWNTFDSEQFSDIQKARRAKRTVKQKKQKQDMLAMVLKLNGVQK